MGKGMRVRRSSHSLRPIWTLILREWSYMTIKSVFMIFAGEFFDRFFYDKILVILFKFFLKDDLDVLVYVVPKMLTKLVSVWCHFPYSIKTIHNISRSNIEFLWIKVLIIDDSRLSLLYMPSSLFCEINSVVRVTSNYHLAHIFLELLFFFWWGQLGKFWLNSSRTHQKVRRMLDTF